jgi:mannose-6-phosphate isomerase-like protein (cupin superfamily)
LYFIHSGQGEFVLAEQRQAFEAGMVFFVPAGAEHRFENFTADFSTWVVFWGPEGGEAA